METTTHTPRTARRLTRCLSVLAAAAAVAALVGLAVAIPAQAQVAGATYSGSFEPISNGCGDGTLTLRLSDDGTTIDFITVDGATFANVPIDGLRIPLDPPIPIQPDRSFDQTFEQLPGIPIGVSGSFDGASVSGVIDVSVLGCAPSFTATTSDATEETDDEMILDDDMTVDDIADDSADDQMDAMPDTSGPAPEASIAMPAAGTGPGGQSNLWLAAAAAMALLGLTLVRFALARVSRE